MKEKDFLILNRSIINIQTDKEFSRTESNMFIKCRTYECEVYKIFDKKIFTLC